MKIKQFYANNREEWRNWLMEHHATEKEIWLVYYKKHTEKPSVTYPESVEEALCFGWIDGIKKRIDDERYTHRFTLRTPKSSWSAFNIKLAQKLINDKKMTDFGLEFYEKRTPYNHEEDSSSDNKVLTPKMEQQLQNNPTAWINFINLAPGYRKQYINWISSAKREETKQKRLNEAIKLLTKNMKLGMK
jgi:uncharacterized protein YdeI (YjbR/CyaY-like superfamily)